METGCRAVYANSQCHAAPTTISNEDDAENDDDEDDDDDNDADDDDDDDENEDDDDDHTDERGAPKMVDFRPRSSVIFLIPWPRIGPGAGEARS